MNVLEPVVIVRMQELFADGVGVRAVARELQVSEPTAVKYLKAFETAAGLQFQCGCGRHLRHKGKCGPKIRRCKGGAMPADIPGGG